MKFRYGQRVKCIAEADKNKSVIGLIGTVLNTGVSITDEQDEWIGVAFDRPIINGHGLTDNFGSWITGESNGWFCPPDTLIPYDEPININEFI